VASALKLSTAEEREGIEKALFPAMVCAAAATGSIQRMEGERFTTTFLQRWKLKHKISPFPDSRRPLDKILARQKELKLNQTCLSILLFYVNETCIRCKFFNPTIILALEHLLLKTDLRVWRSSDLYT